MNNFPLSLLSFTSTLLIKMPPKAKRITSTAKTAEPSSKIAGKRVHKSDSDNDTQPPQKKAKNDNEDKKMVSVLRRGAAPVDPISQFVGEWITKHISFPFLPLRLTIITRYASSLRGKWGGLGCYVVGPIQ